MQHSKWAFAKFVTVHPLWSCFLHLGNFPHHALQHPKVAIRIPFSPTSLTARTLPYSKLQQSEASPQCDFFSEEVKVRQHVPWESILWGVVVEAVAFKNSSGGGSGVQYSARRGTHWAFCVRGAVEEGFVEQCRWGQWSLHVEPPDCLLDRFLELLNILQYIHFLPSPVRVGLLWTTKILTAPRNQTLEGPASPGKDFGLCPKCNIYINVLIRSFGVVWYIQIHPSAFRFQKQATLACPRLIKYLLGGWGTEQPAFSLTHWLVVAGGVFVLREQKRRCNFELGGGNKWVYLNAS